jgi:transposase-like protein
MDAPKTLQQAIVYFSDKDRCFQYAMKLRWQDGVVSCPRCGSERNAFIKTRRVWECYGCKKQFSLKIGTIFEDSPLGLDKWMMAMWMIAACKNGVSSYEIHRSIGVTQKSAWFMLHRIRKAMQDGSLVKLGGNGGTVEADETFIGGKARNMHKHIRARKITAAGVKDKTAVMGMLERGGKVRTMVIQGRKRPEIQAAVRQHVQAGSALYTDALRSYIGLNEFEHKVIDHAIAYVDGKIHTNGLENYWSLLKRALGGTYVSVEPFHLFRYLDEQSFRYNNRTGMNDQTRFEKVMNNIADKRLTYKALIGPG